MGRIYKPVEIGAGRRSLVTIAIIDTGADRSVVSARKAHDIKARLFGEFRAVCASDTELVGKYADVRVREIESGRRAKLLVGVSDIPFNTDDINDDGVEVILGTEYLQMTRSKLKI